MKKQTAQENMRVGIQIKTEEELGQVADGGGATMPSPEKSIMPVKSGEKK